MRDSVPSTPVACYRASPVSSVPTSTGGGFPEWNRRRVRRHRAEIIQRIEEDGGVTTSDRLFEELPRKFEVSPASIHAYLQTPKFAVDNGNVSLADPSSVRLRALDDVIDGRDERHAPYWSFEVHQRYLEGHSLAGVPPELAKYVGCAPDAGTDVQVISPTGCGALSVRWPLASMSGATIGYLARALAAPWSAARAASPHRDYEPRGGRTDDRRVRAARFRRTRGIRTQPHEAAAQGDLTVLTDQPSVRPGLFRLPDDPVASTILIPGFRAAESVRGAFGVVYCWVDCPLGTWPRGVSQSRTRRADLIHGGTGSVRSRTSGCRTSGGNFGRTRQRRLVADVFVSGRADATALGRHALDCFRVDDRQQKDFACGSQCRRPHPTTTRRSGCSMMAATASSHAVRATPQCMVVAEGVEHLDVDVSWIASSRRRVDEGVAILDDWSEGRSLGIDRVVELPDALAQNIIETAPDTPPQPEDYARAAARDSRSRSRSHPARTGSTPPAAADSRQAGVARRYLCPSGGGGRVMGRRTESRAGHRLPWATGAGKTLTALICAARAQDRLDGRAFLAVVSAPSIPLIKQWHDEIEKFGIRAVTPALEPSTHRGPHATGPRPAGPRHTSRRSYQQHALFGNIPEDSDAGTRTSPGDDPDHADR